MGIVDLARHARDPGLVDWLVGPGRFVALAVSALVPAFLVLRRRDAAAAGVGLSLALFLLLTTNFGMQYVAWAAAAVLLLVVWGGLAYNLSAGVLLVVIYTHWANRFPWYEAFSKQLTPSQERLGWLVWCVLLLIVVLGIRGLWRWPKAQSDADDQMRGIGFEATPSKVPIAYPALVQL